MMLSELIAMKKMEFSRPKNETRCAAKAVYCS